MSKKYEGVSVICKVDYPRKGLEVGDYFPTHNYTDEAIDKAVAEGKLEIERDPLTKVAERQKELREMHSRELLHRYQNVAGGRAIWNHQGRFEDVKSADKELQEYENELLYRLNVPALYGIATPLHYKPKQ